MTDDRPETPAGASEPREPDAFEEGIQRLAEKAETLHVDRPEGLDEEFERRMKSLEERASAHRELRENEKREQERRTRGDRDAARGLGLGLSVAYTIIGLPVFGYGVGWLISRSTGSTTVAGFGMLIGAVLGIAVAIVMLNRQQA